MNQFYNYNYNRDGIISELKRLKANLKAIDSLNTKLDDNEKQIEVYRRKMNEHHVEKPDSSHFLNEANEKIRKRKAKFSNKWSTIAILSLLVILAVDIASFFWIPYWATFWDYILHFICTIPYLFLSCVVLAEIDPPPTKAKDSSKKSKENNAEDEISPLGCFGCLLPIVAIAGWLSRDVFFYYGIIFSAISILHPLVYLCCMPYLKKRIIESNKDTPEDLAELELAKKREYEFLADYRAKVAKELKENKEFYSKKIDELNTLNLRHKWELYQCTAFVNSSTLLHPSCKNLDCVTSLIGSMERYPDYTLTDALKDYDRYRANLVTMQFEHQRRWEARQELDAKINNITSQLTSSINSIRDAEYERTQMIKDEIDKIKKDLQ